MTKSYDQSFWPDTQCLKCFLWELNVGRVLRAAESITKNKKYPKLSISVEWLGVMTWNCHQEGSVSQQLSIYIK